MAALLRRLGATCAAHPLRVVAAWIVIAAAITVAALTVGGAYSDSQGLPASEDASAVDRLSAHFPAARNESADLLVTGRGPAALTRALGGLPGRVAGLPHVAVVDPPRISADATTALVHVQYDVQRYDLHAGDLTALRRAATVDRADVAAAHVGGGLAYDVYSPATGIAEKVGIGIAVLILLLAFGSVIAALMPVATAALALTTGLGLVKLLAVLTPVNADAPALASMIGLGVGTDYALFIVTRHRERLRAGATPRQAATDATATAGSAVLWAGITVVAAICGLAVGGIPVVTSLGYASAVVVATCMLASLTILPALLALTDTHIDALHLPMPHLRHERIHRLPRSFDPSIPVTVTWWTRWALAIGRRPLRYLLAASGALVLLSLPALGMRLGAPDGSAASRGSEQLATYQAIARAFGPGAVAPLDLVAELPRGAAAQGALARVAAAVRSDPDVAAVLPAAVSPDATTAEIAVEARSGPQSAATAALVPRLRSAVLPPVERLTGTRVLVAGLPAGQYDVGQRVLRRLPVFVGAVLLMSFLLLMVVFRSLLVPLKAVLLNVLSISSALGIVVAVFQWGWLRQLVGLHVDVPVEDVVPMMMFAIVFGLSMDYEVFLLSRVREEWLVDGDGRASVVRGLASTARVITAAAAIMVAIFSSFTLSGDPIVKTMGLGLAVAVAIDATVIRLVLVPATMSLLGRANWWLPRWLDRLIPHVAVDDPARASSYGIDGGRPAAGAAPKVMT